jgi:hypothetical protein
MPDSVDSRIIKSVQEMHANGKPILAYSVGMHAGLDNSTVSRWFRDHGIFYDCWRREWLIIIPELAAPVVGALPRGAINQASWLSTGWLRRGYAPKAPTVVGSD